MAHGNHIGSSLRSHDSSQTRHLQRIPLGVPGQRSHDAPLQGYESASLRLTFGRGLCGNVDHSGLTGAIVVGELLRHLKHHLTRSYGINGSRGYSLETADDDFASKVLVLRLSGDATVAGCRFADGGRLRDLWTTKFRGRPSKDEGIRVY